MITEDEEGATMFNMMAMMVARVSIGVGRGKRLFQLLTEQSKFVNHDDEGERCLAEMCQSILKHFSFPQED